MGVALLGACAYAVADNTADSLMYLRIKRWGGGQGVCEAVGQAGGGGAQAAV